MNILNCEKVSTCNFHFSLSKRNKNQKIIKERSFLLTLKIQNGRAGNRTKEFDPMVLGFLPSSFATRCRKEVTLEDSFTAENFLSNLPKNQSLKEPEKLVRCPVTFSSSQVGGKKRFKSMRNNKTVEKGWEEVFALDDFSKNLKKPRIIQYFGYFFTLFMFIQKAQIKCIIVQVQLISGPAKTTE